jgi:DNA polymerase-1
MRLILDGNNLAWAGFYALERAMKPEDEERRRRVAMLGLLGSALGAIARAGEPPNSGIDHELDAVAICFDEGRPLRRRKLYPPYQTGREGDPKFIENEPTILSAIDEFCTVALKMLPVDVLRGKNTEADDLIAGVVQRNGGNDTRIVSTDRDFLQLIGPRLSVYAPVKKLVVTEANFGEATAPKTSTGQPITFPRDRFLDYRTLIGDPSDNIAGVPGMGELSAARLLAAAPLADYFGAPGRVRAALGRRSAALEQAFTDGTAREIASRNRTLMDLRVPSPVWDDLDNMTSHGTWDAAGFKGWLDEQRANSVDSEALVPRLERLASARG